MVQTSQSTSFGPVRNWSQVLARFADLGLWDFAVIDGSRFRFSSHQQLGMVTYGKHLEFGSWISVPGVITWD